MAVVLVAAVQVSGAVWWGSLLYSVIVFVVESTVVPCSRTCFLFLVLIFGCRLC